MTTSPGPDVRCSVVGAEKLPAEVGGADAVCAAVRGALQGSTLAKGATVTVKIRSSYSAAASMTTAAGRELPEVNVAISDRALNQRSIAMLAEGIARQVNSSAR
ncbi:MAG: hypothetical protein M3Q52_08485 [Pseudomonadota bacterium]|nr:hypothetical protein [Pseudomonadota bacterium]